jgi:putative membrane-bound dehydrogenase-like protein
MRLSMSFKRIPLLISALACLAVSAAEPPRLAILTDIGGDPDDTQSLVRLMVYANEFQIEALVASASGTRGELPQSVTRSDLILGVIDAYAEVLPNLQRNADGWPAADALRRVVKSGNRLRGREQIGEGHDTEASQWLIERIDAGSQQHPLNIAIWGGQTDFAQALWRVRDDRGAAGLAAFVERFRVYDINDQDGIADWMRAEFPGMHYILAHASQGRDKREGTYRGMYLTGDESLTSRQWIEQHVLSCGPLGELYPTQTWTAPNPHACMKEGDTPSWFFFLPSGGNLASDPTAPGWGGRFARQPDGWFRDLPRTDDFDPRTEVSRWRSDFQEDFARRMKWCLAEASPRPRATTIGEIEFTLADGLAIEKVAGEPLIRWPIVAAWDHRGRLVVAESGGVSWPIQQHNELGLHKIVRLVDRDGDGSFDERIVAADQLAFPEGVLCLGNEILVAAPPQIWRLIDSDDDGVCEQREVWFDGKTVTNCANDLHGPYLGLDGWIYWCKGAFGEQTHQWIDGRQVTSSAAHIYRRKLAGGPIEAVISGGMDNPVEVAETPEGEKFFTSTFLQHPRDGLRDGIAHAVYGAVFGKDHAVVAGLTRTGPLLGPMTHLGPAAPSGLICLESPSCKQLLVGDRDSRVLLAALFNLHKLTAHELTPDGASYRTVDRDVVATERVDFHPTDVIEDADGSLLVLDTGGWYDLCCPTSRIDQKTAAGGIYRVSASTKAAGKETRELANLDGLDLPSLIVRLRDPRPWVRREAGRRLQGAGDPAVEPLAAIAGDTGRATDERQTAIWALCRLETATADAAVARLLDDPSPSVVRTALHVLSLHRVATARKPVETLLTHDSPLVQRVAAETLGRIGDSQSAGPILEATPRSAGDHHLQHALLFSLIEIGRHHESLDLVGLADSDAKLHAVLQVLAQLKREQTIEAEQLLTALHSDHAELPKAAAELLARRPAAASGATEALSAIWTSLADSPPASEAVLVTLLGSWKQEPPIEQLVSQWLAGAAALGKGQQQFLASHLNAIAAAPLAGPAANTVASWLEHADPEIRRPLLRSLAAANLGPEAIAPLTSLILRRASASESAGQRLEWLAALPAGFAISSPGQQLESFLLASLLADDPTISLLAAEVLARIELDAATSGQLAQSLSKVPPRHLMTAIEAAHRGGGQAADELMLNSLVNIPAARTLPEDFLVRLFKDSPEPLRQRAQRTAAELIRPAADVQATVARILGELDAGDPVRGLQIFRGSKAACSACHRMGYIGSSIGPELTQIGRSRTAESLLEAILFPSSRLEQSYQSTRIVTLDGSVYNGLIRSRSSSAVEIQLNADRVITIATDQIEIEQPSDVSVMPSGMGELLTRQELADLLALLRSAQ